MRTPGAGEDSRGVDVLRGLNPWTGGGSLLLFGLLASLRQKSREVFKSWVSKSADSFQIPSLARLRPVDWLATASVGRKG
jgi:hypothetical protein